MFVQTDSKATQHLVLYFGLFLLAETGVKKSKREPSLDTPYTSKWKSFWSRAKSLTFIIQREVRRKLEYNFILSTRTFLNYF